LRFRWRSECIVDPCEDGVMCFPVAAGGKELARSHPAMNENISGDRPVTVADVQRVHFLVEACLQRFLSKVETTKVLVQAGVSEAVVRIGEPRSPWAPAKACLSKSRQHSYVQALCLYFFPSWNVCLLPTRTTPRSLPLTVC
jgi:hypothetical protein